MRQENIAQVEVCDKISGLIPPVVIQLGKQTLLSWFIVAKMFAFGHMQAGGNICLQAATDLLKAECSDYMLGILCPQLSPHLAYSSLPAHFQCKFVGSIDGWNIFGIVGYEYDQMCWSRVSMSWTDNTTQRDAFSVFHVDQTQLCVVFFLFFLFQGVQEIN